MTDQVNTIPQKPVRTYLLPFGLKGRTIVLLSQTAKPMTATTRAVNMADRRQSVSACPQALVHVFKAFINSLDLASTCISLSLSSRVYGFLWTLESRANKKITVKLFS